MRIVTPESSARSLGSGTLVYATDQHGLIITNWHVVRDATAPVQVLFPDGFRSAGTVMKIDEAWDLAAVGIWRPKAQPVELAEQPPRQGEPLTIAGYGQQGQYRAVQGRCTQYVAPGEHHPYEMIELSAEARQGDSGGPIFNSQGRLAGVLLGARKGRTVGSYCGRVNVFLADVRGALDSERQRWIAERPSAPARPLVEIPSPRRDLADARLPETSELPISQPNIRQTIPQTSPADPLAPLPHPTSQPLRVATIERQDEFFRPATVPEPSWQPQPRREAADPVAPAAYQAVHDDEVLRLTDIIGHTRGEQIKSVLAGIGVLSLLIFTLRVLRTED